MAKFTVDDSKRSIYKQQAGGRCWHCDQWTRFADIDFGAFLCSTECQDAKVTEYNQAATGANNWQEYDPDYWGAWYE